jgi:hypothetical protein
LSSSPWPSIFTRIHILVAQPSDGEVLEGWPDMVRPLQAPTQAQELVGTHNLRRQLGIRLDVQQTAKRYHGLGLPSKVGPVGNVGQVERVASQAVGGLGLGEGQ